MHQELDELKKKVAAFNENMRKQEAELLQRKQDLDSAVSKLDSDKEGFRNHVANTVRSTEEGMKRLKEEEAKLVRLREELRRESNKIKEERASVSAGASLAPLTPLQQPISNVGCERSIASGRVLYADRRRAEKSKYNI